jgi:hypothetical protein
LERSRTPGVDLVATPHPETDKNDVRYLVPRVADALFCAIFIAAIMDGPRLLNGDGDIGRHLTVGAYILDAHRIPTRDLFSYSMADQPLTPHEWLADVGFAASYRLLGLSGVVWLSALLLAVTVALVCGQARRRSALVLVPALLAVWAATASHIHWLARPHLWTMLMVVLWSGHLERLRRGETKSWWLLPVLMVFWANLHGAFIAGFVIWLMYGVGSLLDKAPGSSPSEAAPTWWRYWALGGITAIATSLLNPSGWHLWTTSFGYLGNRYLVDHTVEYLSPDFHSNSTWPFLGLLISCFVIVGMGWARLTTRSTLIVGMWAAMSLYSARNIPLFVLMAAPILADGLARGTLWRRNWVPAWRRIEDSLAAVERSLCGHLWPALIVIGVGLTFGVGATLNAASNGSRFDSTVFPVQAVDWMEQHRISGNGFNYFPWGGYLLHRRWPEQRVFIDGQTDFYGEALTRQYETVITLDQGWRDVLSKYRVRWILMPRHSLLVRALSETNEWSTAYEDQTAVLVVRRP